MRVPEPGCPQTSNRWLDSGHRLAGLADPGTPGHALARPRAAEAHACGAGAGADDSERGQTSPEQEAHVARVAARRLGDEVRRERHAHVTGIGPDEATGEAARGERQQPQGRITRVARHLDQPAQGAVPEPGGRPLGEPRGVSVGLL